jgi:hypothetical protein
MTREDIEAVAQTLAAIRLIREQHGSGPEGFERVEIILALLRGTETNLFRCNMANAIRASLRNQGVEAVLGRPRTKVLV